MSTLLAEPATVLNESVTPMAWLESRLGRQKALARLEREFRLERKATSRFYRRRFLSREAVTELWAPLALRASFLHGRGERNSAMFTLTRTEIVLERLPPSYDGFTILHLTDLHADISRRAMDALPAVLSGLEYDICAITGDFRGKVHGPHRPSMDIVERLIPHITSPIVGIMGNHDPAAVAPELERMGLRMLMNESLALERGADRLWIAGVDDPHYYKTHDFKAAVAGIPDGECVIMLSHSTDGYQDGYLAGSDLMLCGHTHGGQICLPGGIPLLTSSRQPRNMASGFWRHERMVGYTSRGVGTSAVEARFNCAPEVALHKLVTRHHVPDGRRITTND